MAPEQTSEGWQLAGQSAESYERYLVPALFAPWAERLVDLLAPEPGDRVLDVGCGTGIVARTAARRIGEGVVVGIDPNAGMLETARRSSTDLRPAIEWKAGEAVDLPFPDGSFDVVLSQQAIQFFADPTAALEEMRRVLVPGGRAGVSVLRSIEHSPIYVPFAEVLERHADPAAGTMMRSPFASWNADELREMAGRAGFGDVRVRLEVSSVRYPSTEEFVRREAASSPLAEPISAMSPDARETMVRELDAELDAYRDDEGIVSPMELYVVAARR